MDATLSIASADLVAEDLQHLTHNLCRTLNRETEVEAMLPEQSGGAGTKGDPITLSTLMLTFLSSGAAVALFNVLKSYFERSPSLEMELQRKDGKIFKLRAKNLHSDQINQTMELVHAFLGGAA